MPADATSPLLLQPAQAPPAPPAPPAPVTMQTDVPAQGPPSEAATALERELGSVRAAVQKIATRAGAGRRDDGLITNGDGKLVITGRDGRSGDHRSGPAEPRRRSTIWCSRPSEPRGMPPQGDTGPPESAVVMVGIDHVLPDAHGHRLPAGARAGPSHGPTVGGRGGSPDDLAPRLERLEQAVEGVALEMERVAEAQRFSARLLSERLPEALPRIDANAAEMAQGRRLEG